MNKLNTQKRAQILNMLVEGNSMRSTARMADVSVITVMKLLGDAGKVCAKLHDQHVRGLNCHRIQCDEIWAFCYAKQKNVAKAKAAPEGAGDVWTWTSLCADTKLICNWAVGGRGAEYAMMLMDDLRSRLNNRVQLTTDGHRAYLEAVEGAFGGDIDYAQLVKIYGEAPESMKGRYSPAECCGIKKTAIEGKPDIDHVSTSYVERQNLTIRMCNRRFTRLTNGFSKKVENHAHALALHFMYYNFCRIHKTLRVTPAMQAGIADHVWTLEEIVVAMDAKEVPQKRGPYKKRAA